MSDKKIKTLIVDDEKEAREGLKILLKKDPVIEICSLCSNGIEAIKAAEKFKPDLLFLDIQMPEINGFEVLNSLPGENMPEVIFTTAYDKYTLKAFEIHALDYLLKPFSDKRFYEALDFAKQHILEKKNINEKVISLLREFKASTDCKDDHIIKTNTDENSQETKLIVKSGGKIYFIDYSDIIRFEADDYFAKVHTNKKIFLIRESLKSLENKLPQTIFLRIHRSNIINKNLIEIIEPFFNGDFFVTLSGGTKLRGSRNFRKNLF